MEEGGGEGAPLGGDRAPPPAILLRRRRCREGGGGRGEGCGGGGRGEEDGAVRGDAAGAARGAGPRPAAAGHRPRRRGAGGGARRAQGPAAPASPVPAFHAAAGAGTASEAGGDRDPGRIREWPGFPYGSRGVGSGIPAAAAAGDGDGDRGGERYGLIGAREVCLKITSTLSCERIIFSIFFTTFLTVAGMIIELKRTIPF